MLLLVTIGLVLVGAVSLVIGFVSNSLPPIYLSIGCSVLAGLVLVVFSRMSKRQEAGGPSSSSYMPTPSPGSWTPPPAPTPPPPPPVYQPPAPMPTGPSRTTERVSARSVAAAAAPVAVDDFPIEDYDTRRVSQILPALDDLDLDELDMVREREEDGKNRSTVLRRIDTLMDELEAEEGGDGTAVADGGDDDLVEEEDFEDDEEEDFEDEDEDEDEVDRVDHTLVMPAVSSADHAFPITGYDRLPVAQILPLLDDLEDDELDMVAEREEQGKNRAAILDRIDDMFEPIEDEPAPPPPPPPAVRAPARKAAAVKRPAPGRAAPAKRAVAKKAAVKKAAVKKAAPAKRATPAKRAVKKR